MQLKETAGTVFEFLELCDVKQVRCEMNVGIVSFAYPFFCGCYHLVVFFIIKSALCWKNLVLIIFTCMLGYYQFYYIEITSEVQLYNHY